ncbi:uncharacterized protein ZBAI_01497 [Zygosaccharomyces bailii ISA1307]|uniref:ZYBA0S09-01442g1_1 n=1 Tax=Zygosaccharomyces bailii (strain CLIB 213 / ATCC 58445 / CBS 680 / BCRC 21525 / NBRC 1098 / NCYC 1416 / NRRL Y-2227) TaxID=1333698 RepID=A0A8J2X3N3_ZYGB2|nr:ZYBA0S09-01442g1_1 [Zygosaccharomyces bailii CLIB 213]CDH09713.1 uncharacterized protein ZBAI_01497 [Zygosaccharomyces bailii ISA1307]
MSSDTIEDDFVNPFEEVHPPIEAIPDSPPPPFESTEALPSTPAEAPPLSPGLLNYYSRYFQLTTADFKLKTLASLSLRSERPSPDLYGPIWITATVVMARFLGSGVFALCIDGILRGVAPATFQFSKLVHSTWLFYGYTFVMPFVAQRLLADSSFIELLTTYGYVNVVWIGASLMLSGVDEFGRLGRPVVVTLIEWVVVALVAAKRSLSLYSQLESRKALVLLALDVLFCVAAKFLLY